MLAGHASLVSAAQAQPQRLFLHGTEHAYIDAKNLAALRTLFAVAARLALLLGDSWMLVLGPVNCLDCLLATPRQSAQTQASVTSEQQVL